MKKIIVFIIALLLLFILNPLSILPAEKIEWDKNDYLIIKSKNGFTIIHPFDHYRNIHFGIKDLLNHDQVLYSAVDYRANQDTIALAYYTYAPSCKLILRLITPKDKRRIELLTLTAQKAAEAGYPQIWTSDNYFWIKAGKKIYQVSKDGEHIVSQEFDSETQIIKKNFDAEIYKQTKDSGMIAAYVREKSGNSTSDGHILGWGVPEESVISDFSNGTYEIGLTSGKKKSMIRPSYGRMQVDGNLKNLLLFQFIHESGEVPLFDPRLCVMSFLERINFRYYQQYLLDLRRNKYYAIPSQIRNNYAGKDDYIVGYNGKVNMESMQKIAQNP